MSLRWLSTTVGAKFRPGIRRKMAPEARRDLTSEIDTDVLAVQRVWIKNLVRDPDASDRPVKCVVAWIDAGGRAEVAAWLVGPGSGEAIPVEQPEVRTDWVFFPAAPEAILIGVVEGNEGDDGGGASFRFNLKFGADTYRRHLELLARSGELGLSGEPLQVGPERQLESACIFVPVQTGPLRAFLRELPPVPVV